MKYAVITCSNGTFKVQTEWTNDIKGARIDFRTQCNILDNADDVKTGAVILVNENFDVVDDYKEIIIHEETPEVLETIETSETTETTETEVNEL